MAEKLNIVIGDRDKRYQELLPQLKALISDELNEVANLANISAALRQTFKFFWVGFYKVDSDTELVLGPFQGDIACTRIIRGSGVCGTSWQTKQTIIVPDVDKYPGHISCSVMSKSEIVVPILKSGKVRLLLDIDSNRLDDFSEIDKKYLEELAVIISNSLCD